MARLAIDIGGTFTDAVYLEDETGDWRSAKLPTTSDNPVEGILQALDLLAVQAEKITSFIHGNTLVVNVIVERKGARTALVTTAGFRDVLEIARGSRANIYDFTYNKPQPFVPRELRFEVRERIDHKGNILSALALTDADKLVDAFRFEGVESVAIQFMHSYAEPQHETLIANYLASRLHDITITTSSELTREWGEYERANTAVLNAYVQPTALLFLESLETSLAKRGLQCPITAVQSNGGHTTMASAKRYPITLIESGPAAGIGYAKRIAEEIGEQNVIFFDVGGTTAKCAVLENGETPVTTDYRLERSETNPGYPIKIPVVDVVEIGTGGGSIARIDSYGVLTVGPSSAGATPGPACFDKGGTQATTTDAMLHLGILNPENFAGGKIRLDLALAQQSLKRLARELDASLDDTASAIIQIANSNMINALRLVSVRRGHDPRDFVMIATGGAGPMHASVLVQELGARKVIVPPDPGFASAWGMFTTFPRKDFVRTHLQRLDHTDIEDVERVFGELQEEAALFFRDSADLGSSRIAYRRSLDMRYLGQQHVVSVPVSLPFDDIKVLENAFQAIHERNFTFTIDDTPTELVNFKLTAEVLSGQPELKIARTGKRSSLAAYKGDRMVSFGMEGVCNTRIFDRSLMPIDLDIAGPAIIEEPSATTIVLPHQRLRVDDFLNLHIS